MTCCELLDGEIYKSFRFCVGCICYSIISNDTVLSNPLSTPPFIRLIILLKRMCSYTSNVLINFLLSYMASIQFFSYVKTFNFLLSIIFTAKNCNSPLKTSSLSCSPFQKMFDYIKTQEVPKTVKILMVYKLEYLVKPHFSGLHLQVGSEYIPSPLSIYSDARRYLQW